MVYVPITVPQRVRLPIKYTGFRPCLHHNAHLRPLCHSLCVLPGYECAPDDDEDENGDHGTCKHDRRRRYAFCSHQCAKRKRPDRASGEPYNVEEATCVFSSFGYGNQ